MREDVLAFDGGGDYGDQFVARSSLGRLWVATGSYWTAYSRPRGWELSDDKPEPINLGNDMDPGPLWPWLGVSAGRVDSAIFDSFEVAAPHWLLALLCAIPAGVTIARRLWQWRACQQSGLCNGCGYDLRASPGRCPECGAVAVKPAAA